jgi:hypothetical protein
MSESQDPHRRQRIAWFIGMNAIAFVFAAVLFFGFLYGHAMDAAFRSLTAGLFEYKLVVILIAMSPLFASLLVGMAYAQRAIRRKKHQAAQAQSQPPHEAALPSS